MNSVLDKVAVFQEEEGEKKNRRFLSFWEQAVFVILVFLITFFAYILIKPYANLLSGGWFVQIIMFALMGFSLAGSIIGKRRPWMTTFSSFYGRLFFSI